MGIAIIHRPEAHFWAFIFCFLCAYSLYWFYWIHRAIPLSIGLLVGLGLLLRVLFLTLQSGDDIYRYLWESKMWAQGLNPYHLAPNNLSLIALRDANWASINHPNFPAIYPPLTQFFFFLFGLISRSIWFFKSMLLVFDLACLILFLKLSCCISPVTEKQNQWLALFFLNPLWILEGAGRGHFESIFLFFILLMLWSLQKNQIVRSHIYWAASLLIKSTSLFLMPLMVLEFNRKNGVLKIILSALTLAITFTCMQLSGNLANLQRFALDFQYNSLIPFLWQKILGQIHYTPQTAFYTSLTLISVGIWGLWNQWFSKNSWKQQGLFWMGLALFFTPTLHAWYFLWILPFAIWNESKPWLLACGTVVLTYAVDAQAFHTGQWQEITWLRFPEFVPPLLLLFYSWKLHGKRQKIFA